jgi:hypothetical protein
MNENLPVIKFWKKATAAKTRTGENIESTIQAIFLQYSTLLSEEASRPWAKVVEEQIDNAPFTNIYGVQHKEKHPRSWWCVAMVVLAQCLWWQRLRGDCGGGVGAVIAAMSLVGTIIAAAALVCAAIAVMAALVQRLRQHRWLVQWLRRRWHWRRDCGNGGGAVIAVAASAQ